MEIMSATSDAVLASDSDIFALLAGLATPRNRRSSKDRNQQELARNVMTALLPAVAPASSLLSTPPTPPESAFVSDGIAAVSGARSAAAQPVSRVRQRQYCRCGGCKWCLDNARWERIFNEKFADRSYYQTLPLRHNSTLAAAR